MRVIFQAASLICSSLGAEWYKMVMMNYSPFLTEMPSIWCAYNPQPCPVFLRGIALCSVKPVGFLLSWDILWDAAVVSQGGYHPWAIHLCVGVWVGCSASKSSGAVQQLWCQINCCLTRSLSKVSYLTLCWRGGMTIVPLCNATSSWSIQRASRGERPTTCRMR